MLPIGDAFSDNKNHNLPNLDWNIKHLIWHGFKKFSIISEIPFRGLDNFYTHYFKGVRIKFYQKENIIELLENDNSQIYFLKKGLFFSNCNYKDAVDNFISNNYEASILGFRGYRHHVGLVDVDEDNLVTNFREKPFDDSIVTTSGELIVTKNKLIEFIKKEEEKLYNGLNIIKLLNSLLETNIFKLIEIHAIKGKLITYLLNSIENWKKMENRSFLDTFKFLTNNN